LNTLFAVVGFAGSYDYKGQGYPQPTCDQASFQTFVRTKNPHAMVVAIKDIRKPIHFNKAWGFDIIVVSLAACAPPNTTMPTVKVHGLGGGIQAVSDGMQFTLLGFGATKGETGAMSNDLKRLDAKVTGIGTSDENCNSAGKESRVAPVACSPEESSSGCEGEVPPPGCTPGKKGAAGDSGGPWVTSNNGTMMHVFVQSSGVQDKNRKPYGYLIRDAWFQDWILEGVKALDACGGDKLDGSDIFVGYAASSDQYCQGQGCLKCMDTTKVSQNKCRADSNCWMKPNMSECKLPGRHPEPEKKKSSIISSGAWAMMLSWCTMFVTLIFFL